MNIDSIKWGNEQQTHMIVNAMIHVPWPCHTWHRDAIDDWMLNNQIDSYQMPIVSVDDRRRQAYNDRGVTMEVLVEALWENNPVRIAELEAIRQSVKIDIPREIV